MDYKAKRDELRIADLESYKPGDWIDPSVFYADHWTGTTPRDASYTGRLQEAQRFIENYFLMQVDNSTKVLCVQRDSGIAITVGEESSSILGNRAVSAVKQLNTTSNYLDKKVDTRFMTPAQRRRHENLRLRVQLQLEAIEHSKVKYEIKAKVKVKQQQAVNN